MLAAVITNNLQKIKALCKEYGVRSLYVIGSAARGDHQFYSDVDLLVDFEKEEGNNELAKTCFWFREELIYALKKPVDLLFYKKALRSKIGEGIERDKVLIYG